MEVKVWFQKNLVYGSLFSVNESWKRKLLSIIESWSEILFFEID